MLDTFIRTYDIADVDLCEEIINNFQHNKDLGCTARRNDGIRRDHQQELNSTQLERDADLKLTDIQWDEMDMRNGALAAKFFTKVNDALKSYVDDLGLKSIVSSVYIKNMLVQGYEADKFESYSTWHCEAGNSDSADRAFVYLLYLNDNFEGGETEFMYQKHKEKPKQGKLVIWPAGYTHTHRGAMLQSGDKYIATGWAFFTHTT